MLDSGFLNEVVKILEFYVPLAIIQKGFLAMTFHIDSLNCIALDSLKNADVPLFVPQFLSYDIAADISTQYRNRILRLNIPNYSELINAMYYSSSFHATRAGKMEQVTNSFLNDSEIRISVLLKEASDDFKTAFFNFLEKVTSNEN